MNTPNDSKDVVREKYGEAARRVGTGAKGGCCGTSTSCCTDPITSNLYDATQAGEIPDDALAASPGRGNPTAPPGLEAGGKGPGPRPGDGRRPVAAWQRGAPTEVPPLPRGPGPAARPVERLPQSGHRSGRPHRACR